MLVIVMFSCDGCKVAYTLGEPVSFESKDAFSMLPQLRYVGNSDVQFCRF